MPTLVLSFFFNDTATTEIYTLSLHDALPIFHADGRTKDAEVPADLEESARAYRRSEEHTSELQSHLNLVCRLLLEKKDPDHQHEAGNGHPAGPQAVAGGDRAERNDDVFTRVT